MMSRPTSVAHRPFVLAGVFISLGSVIADRTTAADQSKGADCAPIDDPVARLACFDAAFPWPPRTSPPRPAAAAAAADVPVSEARTAAPAAPDVPEAQTTTAAAANEPGSLTTAPVAADKPVSEAQKFGLSTEQRAALEAKPAEPAPTATTAAVKTVRKLPSGYMLIGLDNDQVWQQAELDPLIRLQPGDRVTIRKGSLGSYLLVTPAHYSTRVRRIE